MVDVPVTIACGNYDRTRAIKDGTVTIEGCAVTYLPLYPEEIFHRVFKFQEFDISELSFSSYIRTVAAGNAPISAFRLLSRGFFAIQESMSAKARALKNRKISAASASECPNTRLLQSSGCAA